MSQRDDDLRLLSTLLKDHLDELTETEVEAFASMRFDMTAYTGLIPVPRFTQLTPKQRARVVAVHERIVPQYANLVSRGLVPRGREVPTPTARQNLPKKPPPRKVEE